MSRIIAVASGKGGVGKTTVVANLAAALAGFNKHVVAIDGNLTTSNLGLHLGIPLYPVTLQDVMKGTARLRDCLYNHPMGFTVVPADMSLEKIMAPEAGQLVDVLYGLTDKAHIMLIDTAAGLGKEALTTIESADEVMIVTNPELSAITDALKIAKVAERRGTHITGVVLNRIRNEKHEFDIDDARNFLNLPIIGGVPEDYEVRRAIANKEPVVLHNPRSAAAQELMALAARLIGKEYEPVRYSNFLTRLFGWLR